MQDFFRYRGKLSSKTTSKRHLEHMEFHIRQSIVICLLLRTYMVYLCDFFLNFNVFLSINSISNVAFRKFTKTHQWSSAILDQHHYYGIAIHTSRTASVIKYLMDKSQETVTHIQTIISNSSNSSTIWHLEFSPSLGPTNLLVSRF